jgi:hypothetical protein
MPIKKKPSPAQLAARTKFVAMVRAKAAAKGKTKPKLKKFSLGAVKPKKKSISALPKGLPKDYIVEEIERKINQIRGLEAMILSYTKKSKALTLPAHSKAAYKQLATTSKKILKEQKLNLKELSKYSIQLSKQYSKLNNH